MWTFQLRDDARWQDGEPVTAEDVAFTIRVLQDPAYRAGRRLVERGEGPRDGARTVTFTLKTPLGGFLQAATQPIAPAHLLASVPIADLPDHPFGRQPIGSGPFALASLDDDAARAHPGCHLPVDGAPGTGATPRADRLARQPPPRGRPTRPMPYLAGIEFRFFDDANALADAYRSGSLDAASGLSPATARELGAMDREPDPELSGRDLDHRPAQPSTGPPRVPEAGGPDGAARGDRPEPDHHRRVRDGRRPAPGRSRPRRALFDPAADPPVPYDLDAAKAALKAAGWTQAADGWHLPGAKTPLASSC